MPSPEQIEAAAISDATFDGWKAFHTLSRPQRERYLARAKLALEAAEKVTSLQPSNTVD